MDVPAIGTELTALFEAEKNHEEMIRILKENRMLLTKTQQTLDRVLGERAMVVDPVRAANVERSIQRLQSAWIRLRLERSRHLDLFNQTYDDLQTVKDIIAQNALQTRRPT